jgi:hypothetical protein
VLEAGVIKVGMLEAGLGDSLPIHANESIVLSLGEADNAAQAAAEARTLALGAGSAATYASQQAAAAAASAAAANESAEKSGAYYQFSEEDLRIGRPGGRYTLSLSDEGISFIDNGSAAPISLWDGGQMIVSKFVGDEVILANHKIEPRGTRTIFRSM